MNLTRHRRLSQTGITHIIAPLLIVVGVGLVGVLLLVSSHADAPSPIGPVATPSSDVGHLGTGDEDVPSTTITPRVGPVKNADPLYSRGWSGYAAFSPDKPFTHVKADIKIPKTTCTKEESLSAMWIGFDGTGPRMKAPVVSNEVEQIGIESYCNLKKNKTVYYYAWWEMFPHDYAQTIKSVPLKAKDNIHLEITYTDNEYALTIINMTTGKQFTKHTPCLNDTGCKRLTAEWIAERPYHGLDPDHPDYFVLPKWTNGKFINAYASTDPTDTAPLSPINALDYRPVYMRRADKSAILAAPSAPLKASGTTFTMTWKASK